MPYNHRFRQVHLDFHTAPQCQDVGADFDPRVFVETLKMGRVDTINIFAKCHHGYSYYPTRVGTMHPNLKIDLLGQQIEALHRADIRCPIYVSVKWDDLAGAQHPEWVVVNKEGRMVMRPPASGAWGWTTMDVSSGYAEVFLAQIDELCQRYQGEVDGFWLDICFPQPNYSPWAQENLRRAGIDLSDDAAVWRYARQQDLKFFERVTRLIQQKAPQATCYFNGTTTADMAEVVDYVTHFEVESLPTSGGAWGYLHYPIISRQARTYGKQIIGMTGRFHKSWADFGGLKTSDQLDYECGTILAAGGRICVGDQLHPRGVLDPAVYRLLGRSFGQVEQLEPWLWGAEPQAEAAILSLGKSQQAAAGVGAHSEDVEGAAQVLLELGVQFDIVDHLADLRRYETLILPHGAALEADWQARLNGYLAAGGRLVLSGTAGFDAGSGAFQLQGVPVKMIGPAPTVPSYLRPDALLAGGAANGDPNALAADYDYVFYDTAYVVEALPGAECHGELKQALFNRTWEHFTSHQHAPVGASLGAPLMVKQGGVMYFAAPLFAGYRAHDYWAYRELLRNALAGFLPARRLIPGGPGWVEMTLHHQPAGGDHPARAIVHVVAYHPRRSLQSVPHADQAALTAGLSFQLRVESAPQRVYLAPEETALPFRLENGYLRVELPPVGAHTVVVVE
jgi:hypothetical protein